MSVSKKFAHAIAIAVAAAVLAFQSALAETPLYTDSPLNTANLSPPLDPMAYSGPLNPSISSFLYNNTGASGFWTPPINTRWIKITVVGGGGGASGAQGVGSPGNGMASSVDPVATFTGGISGSTLSVTAISFGYLQVGETVYNGSTSVGTITVGSGGTGSYTLSSPVAVAAGTPLTAHAVGLFIRADGGSGAVGALGGNTDGGCYNAHVSYGAIFVANGSELDLPGEWGENVPGGAVAGAAPGGSGGGFGRGRAGTANNPGNYGVQWGAGGGGAGGSSSYYPGAGGQQGCKSERIIPIANGLTAPPTFYWQAGTGGAGTGTGTNAGGNGVNGFVRIEAY